MRCAVIVPAYRAARYLPDCLDALAAAGFGRDEVVVVDDASPDNVPDIARDHGVRLVALTRNAGAGAARNAGAAMTRDADLLVFVDADVRVAPDSRARILNAFASDPDLSALFGSYDAAPAAPGVVSRFRNLLHHHVHQEGAGAATTFWTGLGAVRRDAFDSVGGFPDAHEMMEDIGFGMALNGAGKRIRLDPDLQGKHLKKWTLASMLISDLRDRAIPWTRLLRANPDAPAALNVSRAGKASVAAAGLGAAALALAPLLSLKLAATGAALSVALVAAINWRFLARLARLGAWRVLAAAPVLLWLHFCAAGLGYLWARAFPAPR